MLVEVQIVVDDRGTVALGERYPLYASLRAPAGVA